MVQKLFVKFEGLRLVLGEIHENELAAGCHDGNRRQEGIILQKAFLRKHYLEGMEMKIMRLWKFSRRAPPAWAVK